MHSNEQVHVRAHHSDFKNAGALLTGNATEESAEIGGEASFNQRPTVSRGPHDVQVEAMRHVGMVGEGVASASSILCMVLPNAAPRRVAGKPAARPRRWTRGGLAGRFSGRAEPPL